MARYAQFAAISCTHCPYQNDEAIDKVEEFKRQIIEIDDDNPGKLI